MSLGGHQICIGQLGKRGKSISLMGIKPWFVQHIAILSVGIIVLAVLTDDRWCYIRYYRTVVCNLSCFNSLAWSITNLKNEKSQFKVALLKKFLNAHSFYSVDELFTCTDDMYCWLCDCVNVSYTVIFLLFVCLWHVPHPIVLWLSRIYGMNIYVCMYVMTMQFV